MYTKKVMEHFLHPRNQGKMKNPDGVGKVGNPQCGDVMWFYIKVKSGKITDIKWETYGCAAAIAVSSIVSELAKGKTIKQALSIDTKKILKELKLPAQKIHCSFLGIDALQEAIYDYLTKNKLPIPEKLKKVHQKHKKILEKIEKNL